MMTVGTFVAIVACSPTTRQAAVLRPDYAAQQLAREKKIAALCANQIPRDRKISANPGSAVSICKLGDDGDNQPVIDSSAALLAPSEAYLVSRPVKFDLSNDKGQLNIRLHVGISFPKDVSAENKEKTLKWIGEKCLPRVNEIWSNSKLPIGLKVTIVSPDSTTNSATSSTTSSTKSPTTHSTIDQLIELQLAPKADGTPGDGSKKTTGTAFNMKHWADRAFFYPYTSFVKDPKVRAADQNSNRRFCQSFAVLIGNFLGLESDHSKEAKTCSLEAKSLASAPPAPSAPGTSISPKSTPTPESVRSDEGENAISNATFDEVTKKPVEAPELPFMTIAADPDNAPISFWKTARFTEADLKTILHSACDSVPAPTATPAPSAPLPVSPKPGASPSPSPTPAPGASPAPEQSVELEQWT